MSERNDTAKPIRFRGGGFKPRPLGIVAPIVFIVVIGMWELGSQTGLIGQLILPAPSEAFAAFMELVKTGQLWKHLGASLQRLIFGWTAGTLLGILAGLSIGLFSLSRAGLLPLVSAIFPIPKIALLPLFIIWCGIG